MIHDWHWEGTARHFQSADVKNPLNDNLNKPAIFTDANTKALAFGRGQCLTLIYYEWSFVPNSFINLFFNCTSPNVQDSCKLLWNYCKLGTICIKFRYCKYCHNYCVAFNILCLIESLKVSFQQKQIDALSTKSFNNAVMTL